MKNKQLVKLGLSSFFAVLMLFFLTKSLNREVELKDYLDSFVEKNNQIENENKEQEKNLALYQTPQYKDLYAKENLNLLNPGEKVIVIKKTEKGENFLAKELKVEFEKDPRELAPLEQWKKYFNLES